MADEHNGWTSREVTDTSVESLKENRQPAIAVSNLGDEFAVTQQRFEEIPYAINERIRWFLRKHGRRGAALDLAHKLGLPASSGRIMPRLLSKLLDATPTVEAVAGEAREMGGEQAPGLPLRPKLVTQYD